MSLGKAITHVGLGNFSRAHLAYFMNEYTKKMGPCEWGICAVDRDTPRNVANAEYLSKHDFEYQLITKGTDSKASHQIRVIRDYINMGTSPESALAQLVDPATRICSLTITEKGYYCDVNTGKLFVDNDEIKHDLENPAAPKSAIGLICSALNSRRLGGGAPFTVLSCDNLPGNGHITENAVTQFADLLDPKLHEWISNYVTFPNCMVDRITPQTATPEDPIVSEEFCQWVIEDKFCNGRPYWEIVDNVLLTDDVMPYEKMKVRLLNGSHSALSYLAYLAGHRDVDHAMAEPDVHEFVKMYLSEVAQTVPAVPGIDLSWYQKKLLERFSNPNIKDQIQRLAEDGSSKMQTTMLPVIRAKSKRKKSTPMLSLATAGWIRYMAGIDDFGNEINITDPKAEELMPLARHALGSRDVQPFLEAAFGPSILKYPGFVGKVHAWYERLLSEGVWRVLDSLDEFAFGFADIAIHGAPIHEDHSPFTEMSLQQMVKLTFQDLQQMFDSYDEDDNGYLEYEELKELLKDFINKIRDELPKADLAEVFAIPEEDVHDELLDEALAALPDPEDDTVVRMLLMRLDADEDGKIAPDEFIQRFHEVVTIRYHQFRAEAMPVPSEATALALPPQTFRGSWSKIEHWAREEPDDETKAKAKAAEQP
mmetsp:Transcript_24153/g.47147  ORF Transcript_24153/g.47147 Transcript_24153/m.47147 type:complete len:651 (+) Transcript_24153:67-2019(+)|eukprot:CAMPEP_0167786212 /NCGR_PEP_ID=MMETSP0111_2-20121227/8654_1 /TAXON_ID=91324 /ORGANISM="Lotharella globosa, Strain CCCM811" /LENGTH=650 /DNA_ID=CAMNT_0007677543 /DNA_START=63 /DNA_END=2015 /DNA_ORIENTATION=-